MTIKIGLLLFGFVIGYAFGVFRTREKFND